MSKLQEKSNINFVAAAILIDKGLFAPSVHCSYYSCLQLLKFAINDFFDIDYSTLSSNIAISKSNSHKFMIEFVYLELKNKVDIHEARKFKRTIYDLKTFREESDYEDMEVDVIKSNKAYKYAEELISYLKSTFNV